MLTFIKRLLGLTPNPVKIQEEVKAIFIPQMTTASPDSAKNLEAKFIPAAKPNTVAKVRAITDTKPGAVAAAHAPKPGNKKRRPYRGNKVAAGAKVSEGTTKGGNNTVKPAQVAKAKPQAPKAPTAKK